MIRVAVIDSGVNVRHPHICARTHAISLHGPSADDDVGHGTAVMAAIQEKAPDADYYSVKIFGASLRTSTPHLIQAIECAIGERMDFVNLSLGTTNQEYRSHLQAVVDRA